MSVSSQQPSETEREVVALALRRFVHPQPLASTRQSRARCGWTRRQSFSEDSNSALTDAAFARRGSGLSKALGALPLFSPPSCMVYGVEGLADVIVPHL